MVKDSGLTWPSIWSKINTWLYWVLYFNFIINSLACSWFKSTLGVHILFVIDMGHAMLEG